MKKTTSVVIVSLFSIASCFAMESHSPYLPEFTCPTEAKAFLKTFSSYKKLATLGHEIELRIKNADKIFDKNSADYCAYVEHEKKQKSEIERCSPELLTAFMAYEKEASYKSPDPATVERKDSGLGLSFFSNELGDGKILSTGLKTQNGERIAFAASQYMSEGHWLLAVIGVERGFKGRGIGSELFHKTMDELKKKGCKIVDIDPEPSVDISPEEAANMSVADVFDNHTRLHRFYRKLGAVYVEDGDEYVYTIPNN